jgi:hypothetical protein
MSSDPSISSDLDSQPTSQWEACIRSISRTSANPAAPSIANPYFDYVPLELRSHDIRLFSLFPADNFADEITGGLFHASLDSPPPYETVSYVVCIFPPVNSLVNMRSKSDHRSGVTPRYARTYSCGTSLRDLIPNMVHTRSHSHVSR